MFVLFPHAQPKKRHWRERHWRRQHTLIFIVHRDVALRAANGPPLSEDFGVARSGTLPLEILQVVARESPKTLVAHHLEQLQRYLGEAEACGDANLNPGCLSPSATHLRFSRTSSLGIEIISGLEPQILRRPTRPPAHPIISGPVPGSPGGGSGDPPGVPPGDPWVGSPGGSPKGIPWGVTAGIPLGGIPGGDIRRLQRGLQVTLERAIWNYKGVKWLQLVPKWPPL
jgi:hypothetical protein